MDARRIPPRHPRRAPSCPVATARARWLPDQAASEASREEFASAGVGASELGEGGGHGSKLACREHEKRLEPLEKRIELARRPVIRTAADNCFARMKQQVQHRFLRTCEG